MWTRAVVVWCFILVLAILNGALREGILSPRLSPGGAHVASTLLLSVIVMLVAWLTIGWIDPPDRAGALHVGVLWVALTLCFEFLAGHYLFGQPWSTLVADYNLAAGRIWPLVLVSTLLAPLVGWIAAGR